MALQEKSTIILTSQTVVGLPPRLPLRAAVPPPPYAHMHPPLDPRPSSTGFDLIHMSQHNSNIASHKLYLTALNPHHRSCNCPYKKSFAPLRSNKKIKRQGGQAKVTNKLKVTQAPSTPMNVLKPLCPCNVRDVRNCRFQNNYPSLLMRTQLLMIQAASSHVHSCFNCFGCNRLVYPPFLFSS